MACDSESARPSPITWRARSGSGTGSPRSRQAAWMQPTIAPAESMSVPSQSKTTRSNRFGIGGGLPHPLEEGGKIVGQRRHELDAAAGQRMVERELVGVQEHPLEALPRELPVQREVAVLVVAGDRKPDVREVDADLMRAASGERRFEEREPGALLDEAKDRFGGLPPGLDIHAPFPCPGEDFPERELDRPPGTRPGPLREREIALRHPPLPQRRVEGDERRALLRQDEQPGGLAVEAVRELEESGARARRAQVLDDTEAHAAPAVDRHSGGLVDHEQRVVLEGDAETGVATRRGGARHRCRHADRWNPNAVAGLEPVGGFNAAAVDPHLAAPEQPVDAAPGDALDRKS